MSLIEQKKQEEVKKQQEVKEWLSRSVKRTKIHETVQKQDEDIREKRERDRALKEQQKQQRETYAKVVRQSFAPKVSDHLKSEIEFIKERAKVREMELKQIREAKYHDYLREIRSNSKNHEDQTTTTATHSPPQILSSYTEKRPKNKSLSDHHQAAALNSDIINNQNTPISKKKFKSKDQMKVPT